MVWNRQTDIDLDETAMYWVLKEDKPRINVAELVGFFFPLSVENVDGIRSHGWRKMCSASGNW